MNEKEMELLVKVKEKCIEKPEFVQHFINASISALMTRENEMRQMAADMETMASAMCFLAGQNRVSAKLKQQMSDLAISKLEKYFKRTFLRWDDNVVKQQNLNKE